MKLLTAIIKPSMLERMAANLRKANVTGLTVLKAQGFGREYLDADVEQIGFLTDCVKLEMIVPDEQVESLVEMIIKSAATGSAGDGVVFVSEVISARRISDGTDVCGSSRDA